MLGLGIAAEMSWTMAVASNGAAVGEAESTAGMSTTGMGPVYLRRLGIPDAEGPQVGPRSVVGVFEGKRDSLSEVRDGEVWAGRSVAEARTSDSL